MSDPVTNVEIEDVLSSIRKLVSEGEQARGQDREPSEGSEADPNEGDDLGGQGADADPPAEDERPGKLVLTPAQLVTHGDDGSTASSFSGDDEGPPRTADPETPETPDGGVVPHLLDRPIGNFLRRAEDEGAAPDTEARQPDAPAAPAAPDRDAPQADAGYESAPDDREPDAPGRDTVTAEDRRSALEATIAELEASVGGHGFEPDGSEAADTAATLAWPGRRSRIDLGAEAARTVEEAPQATPDPASPAVDDPSNEDTTAEELAEGAGRPDAADDRADDEDLSGLYGLDDAALRTLVAEIVREELQGALGERITRNVRKLVRREIYRILSSQDFE
jgi:hypothetical protein